MASGKRIVLTMQQRVDILKDLETSSIADVAKKHNVNHVTVWRIQQNAITITAFASKGKLEKRRKNLKKPTYDELEQRLLVWVIERRTMGDIISDALLLQKAAELREEFGACSNFKISRGWLANFKRRHRIRLIRKIKEEDSDDDNDECRSLEIKEERIEQIDEDNNAQLWNEQRHEERDEERDLYEDDEEYGIILNREEREELEDVFTCFDRYRNRIPRPTRFHIDGLKLTILGDTKLLSNESTPVKQEDIFK